MTQTITVAGMIANNNGITLYLEDGKTRALDMNGWNTEQIVREIAPGLGQLQMVQINLDMFAKVIRDVVAEMPTISETDGILTVKQGDRDIQAEALRPHIEDIAHFGRSAKGFKNFLRHFSKQEVGHSAEELLDFMKIGAMPIADDGSIIGFKVLNRNRSDDNTADPSVFVDCHTRTVKQQLGSLVYMPRSKVSDDRRQACGTGLHVAAPAYVCHFGGDVVTLVKVKPHDVIRVPRGENSKMGASAYQIVAVLTPDEAQWVRSGKKLADHTTGGMVLANVIVGNHPPITTKTEVGSFGLDRPYNALQKEKTFEEPKPVHVKTTTKSKKKPKKANLASVKRAPKDALSVRKIKDMLAAAMNKRPAKRTPSEVKLVEYQKKLTKAKTLIKGGMSLREAAAFAGIDRNKLSDNLKAGR